MWLNSHPGLLHTVFAHQMAQRVGTTSKAQMCPKTQSGEVDSLRLSAYRWYCLARNGSAWRRSARASHRIEPASDSIRRLRLAERPRARRRRLDGSTARTPHPFSPGGERRTAGAVAEAMSAVQNAALIVINHSVTRRIGANRGRTSAKLMNTVVQRNAK
jgi:hypothetical protein